MDYSRKEFIPLPGREQAVIVYEDRHVLVIDKPAGWMLAPRSWTRTSRNLQHAIESAVEARQHWAKKRNLRFLRYVHRLDAETSGVLIMARNRLAVAHFTRLFEAGHVKKLYLAIVAGTPPETWQCNLPLQVCKTPQPHAKVCTTGGKRALTGFRRVASYSAAHSTCWSVVAVEPQTGRMHQIRAHLAATGHPVLGDRLYSSNQGPPAAAQLESQDYPLALRAIGLYYNDPFTGVPRRIIAGFEAFLSTFRVPKPLIETVANAVKNWPATSAVSPNTRIHDAAKQDVHSHQPRTNP